ncbi:MAG: hypothetical protein ABIP75_03560 [Pyrinomonadaceae bacterium]
MKKRILLAIALLGFGLIGSLDATGARAAQSVCGSPEDQAARVAFLVKLQTAVAAGDKNAVAGLVSFPMRWHHGMKVGSVRGRSAFLKNYDQLLDQKVRDAIAAQKPEELFVRDQGTMIGTGEVWFEQVGKSKQFRIITINN